MHAPFPFNNADVFPQLTLLVVVACERNAAQSDHERCDCHGNHRTHDHSRTRDRRHRAVVAGESWLAVAVHVVLRVSRPWRGLARTVLAARVRAHGLTSIARKPGFALAGTVHALAVGTSVLCHRARVFTFLLVARISAPPHFAVAYASYALPLAAGAPTLGHAAFCTQGQRFTRDLAAVHPGPTGLALARTVLVADTFITASVRALALRRLLIAGSAVPSDSAGALAVLAPSVAGALRVLCHWTPRLAERHHLHLCNDVRFAVAAGELGVAKALSVGARAVAAALAFLGSGKATAGVHVACGAVVTGVAVAVAMPAQSVTAAVGGAETRGVAVETTPPDVARAFALVAQAVSAAVARAVWPKEFPFEPSTDAAVRTAVVKVAHAVACHAISMAAALVRAGHVDLASRASPAGVARTDSKHADTVVVAMLRARSVVSAVGTRVTGVTYAYGAFAVSVKAAGGRARDRIVARLSFPSGRTVAAASEAATVAAAPCRELVVLSCAFAANRYVAVLACETQVAQALSVVAKAVS